MDKSILGVRPGSVIQDTYRVTKLLGEGGMGATFSGINLATEHEVAIKVITPEFARNTEATKLFRREANLLRTVQNDAVVRFETTMMDKSGQLYLVMEYIRGKPLSHYLDKGASLAPEDVLKLGKRLYGGLAAIHKLGIVHRDVSPDNIMIPDDDILGAKLIDFGVASDTVGTEKSIIGSSFAGKISFASPEQLGLGAAPVSALSDVYSLGLVLMRTAGLKVPGSGEGLANAIDARRNNISVQTTSPQLSAALSALLRAKPEDRPTDVAGVFEAGLAGLARPAKTVETAPSIDLSDVPVSGEPAQGESTSSKLPLIAAGIVVLALIGGGSWYMLGVPGSGGTGIAQDHADEAQVVVAADDPFSEVAKLIDAGGASNLDTAFGSLLAMARDSELSQDRRGKATLLIAQMYDPKTFNAARSPFGAANPRAAIRFYTEARDLGVQEAQVALTRLGQE